MDLHCIRITAGGNLINYPGELMTRTADLTTSKLMWNSVLSTEGAKYMCLDIKNFYSTAPLDRFEYMTMRLSLFPSWTKEQYNLDKLAKNGNATRRVGPSPSRHNFNAGIYHKAPSKIQA